MTLSEYYVPHKKISFSLYFKGKDKSHGEPQREREVTSPPGDISLTSDIHDSIVEDSEEESMVSANTTTSILQVL